MIKIVDFHKMRCYIIFNKSQYENCKGVNFMSDNKIITNNIRALRESKGIKQKFIAQHLGISANYYSQIENGHRTPQVEHLLKLRDLFKVSLDDIFFNNDIAERDN